MLVAVVVFLALGSWQVSRRQWRNADLAAKNASIDLPPVPLAAVLADPSAHAWRRATASGRYDRMRSIVVGPDVRDDRRGARVFTPLVLEGAAPDAPRLLVDRGWIASGAIGPFRERDPAGGGDEPLHALTGLVFPLAVEAAPVGPPELPTGVAVQTFAQFDPRKPLQAAALQAALPYRLLPVLLQSEGDGSEQPIASLSRPTSPVNHLGYALFWFGLAVGAVATWIALGRERARTLAAATASRA